MRVFDTCYLTYVDGERKLCVGRWRLVLVDGQFYCEITVDPERYKQLSKFGLDVTQTDLIYCVLLDNTWQIYYKPYPEFIKQRTFDPRRPDEPWKDPHWKWNRDDYEQFAFMKHTHADWIDNWHVYDEPCNSLNLQKSKYEV